MMTKIEALEALADTIRTIREEQVSDSIFGGQTTAERRTATEVYISRIQAEAAKIDGLLDDIERLDSN